MNWTRILPLSIKWLTCLPLGPCNPAFPGLPAGPCSPFFPVGPSSPGYPVSPGAPRGPGGPFTPGAPFIPGDPVTPWAPLEPYKRLAVIDDGERKEFFQEYCSAIFRQLLIESIIHSNRHSLNHSSIQKRRWIYQMTLYIKLKIIYCIAPFVFLRTDLVSKCWIYKIYWRASRRVHRCC